MKATYKVPSTANVPTTNILVEGRCSFKHGRLATKGHRAISMFDDHKYRSDEVGKTDEWCETFRFNMTMSMKTISVQELQQRKRAESKHQNTKEMTNQDCNREQATYKVHTTANIPTTNILVESNRSFKHANLGKK